MANTQAQKKRINKTLHSSFMHPSPQLRKKWEKRRSIEGDGQDVREKEIEEFLNEGMDFIKRKDEYRSRITNELWNNVTFRKDVSQAQDEYKKNRQLPPRERDEKCLMRLIHNLQNKYHLNKGWLLWLDFCINTGENFPEKLRFYSIGVRGEDAKKISLEVYFPLPLEIYEEMLIYLRMKEEEAFGDYYSQKQTGGRKRGNRTEKTIKIYNKILNLRNSRAWRLRTDKDFLEAHTDISRSKLQRAKKWERDGRPGLDKLIERKKDR